VLNWISLNPELLELVKGKRISLIGPAPYLKGQSRGIEFDSYDLIARPNEIIPLPELRQDYGSRTDIFFCNFGTPWMPGLKRKILLNDNENHFKKIQMVVASAIKADHSEGDFMTWSDNHVSAIPSNFDNINTPQLPFYWIGVKDYKALYQRMGVEFNTGIAAILMLLHYPIAELNLAGFTFYNGGNSYDELYCEGHMDSIDTDGRKFGFSGGHGNYAHVRQIEFFKALYNYFPEIIKIDEDMKRVLL
jgi:hypothetical protein